MQLIFFSSGSILRPMPKQTNTPPAPLFEVRACPRCRLRFTIQLGDARADTCPLCRAATIIVEPKYPQQEVGKAAGTPTGPEMEVLLDNIRSAWNVGSMLRTADGCGLRKVHLCGVSSRPDNPKVWKTSLGAENSLPWEFYPDGVEAARALRDRGLRLWALEGGPRAESLFDVSPPCEGAGADAVALVVGNELAGVDPGILALCERVVSLPMQGIKGSLNVAVAFGIATYYLRYGIRQ